LLLNGGIKNNLSAALPDIALWYQNLSPGRHRGHGIDTRTLQVLAGAGQIGSRLLALLVSISKKPKRTVRKKEGEDSEFQLINRKQQPGDEQECGIIEKNHPEPGLYVYVRDPDAPDILEIGWAMEVTGNTKVAVVNDPTMSQLTFDEW
jgi:hypothetical protein